MVVSIGYLRIPVPASAVFLVFFLNAGAVQAQTCARVGLEMMRSALMAEAGGSSAADKLWAMAMEATRRGQWDVARAMFGQFAVKYASDTRAAEAR